MTRLAYAVAPLVLGQLTSACVADGPTSGGDSGAGDSLHSDSFQGDGGDVSAGETGPCPPTSGFGLGVGDVLESWTFEDCDGNHHALDDLCEREAGWIFVYAGW